MTRDAMHEHRKSSVSYNPRLTEEDREKLYQLLRRAKAGQSLSSQDLEAEENTDDHLFSILKEKASKQHSDQIDLLTKLRCELTAYLRSKGYPDPFSQVITDGDCWRPVPDDWPCMSIEERQDSCRPGESLTDGWAFIMRVVEPLSDMHFQAKIASKIAALDSLSGRNERDALVRLGYLLGQFSSRRHLPNVTRGKTILDKASEGGHAKGSAMAERQCPNPE
ncbi:hypothetical protein [Vannielia litorea]|uniref:hypothetical protein n=1 Tax=Vannielia litorea TaxID=1217970 RepID=UPI001BCF5126|nr:hypothetical protein [Vannielia litorea]